MVRVSIWGLYFKNPNMSLAGWLKDNSAFAELDRTRESNENHTRQLEVGSNQIRVPDWCLDEFAGGRFVPVLFLLVSIAVFLTPLVGHADPIPKGWQASNMKAIAYGG